MESIEKDYIPDSIYQKTAICVKPNVPEGITIKKHRKLSISEEIHYGIFATKIFKKNEILWQSYGYVFDINEDLPSYFMFDIPGVGYAPVSLNEHMLHIDDMIICWGFDSLTNHSCDPNSTHIDLSSFDDIKKSGKFFYQHIALRDIQIGEEITCDYTLFAKEVDTGGFICQCGSSNCRKKIMV